MLALFLCVVAFGACFIASRRSLVSGLVTLFAIGYAYGLVRANIPETFSHFIFDAGVVGLYFAQLSHRLTAIEKYRTERIKPWVELLIVWPLLVFFLPIQNWLIQVVGLRGSIFLLPFILLGARLDQSERDRLALWLAGLNVAAVIVGGIEYFRGIETFFPHNQMTELIYKSTVGVGESAAYRIPSSFANAHAYGGTMVATLPFLAGALVQKRWRSFQAILLTLGTGAALLGVLMSAARIHFIAAAVLTIVTTFSLRSRIGYAFGWMILIGAIAWTVSGEERLQRFLELRDTDTVTERISSSVNMRFFEIAAAYPFGNGLGGGGTSIPYFLQDEIRNPVAMENEYARIMLEQGVVGLVFWGAFIIWIVSRRNDATGESSRLGRRLAKTTCLVFFIASAMGTGLLTSIPQTSLFLLLVGWVGARQAKTRVEERSAQAALPINAPVLAG
jgi:hypothetical protein